MSEQVKSVLFRFLRGAVAGGVSSMVVTIPANVSSLDELVVWLHILLIAGLFGSISGGLLALDKLYRYTK